MRVLIQTQGLNLSREDQNHIRQRLRQTLSRFGEKAIGVTLYLRDTKGPRGSEDTDCQLVVDLEDTTAVVRDRGHQVRALVDRALHRAVHTIGKQLGRIRDKSVRAPQFGKGRGRPSLRDLDALPDGA